MRRESQRCRREGPLSLKNVATVHEVGVLQIDLFGGGAHTIRIELHLQVSSFNCMIIMHNYETMLVVILGNLNIL